MCGPHNADVSRVHSIGGNQVGWDEVRALWENEQEFAVRLSDQLICVGGDLSYEVGTQHVDVLVAGNEVRTDFRVTNIYRREGGEWRMVHPTLALI